MTNINAIQWDLIFDQLLSHLQYSFFSILFSILIGVGISILIYKNKWLSNFFIQTTGALQTFPSIALFGLLIPIVPNITVLIVITLTAYGIFPIVSNSIIGLNKPTEATIDAAKSIALNKFNILWKIRMRIGLPTIIAGIRISSTLIIGVATMAAIIGGGGLGELILTGINRQQIGLVMQGAIPVALVSIVTSLSLNMAERSLTVRGK